MRQAPTGILRQDERQQDMKSTAITLAALCGFATAALADPVLDISDVKAFETAPTAMAGGGFMTITNSGDTDDRLIGILADYPRVELHTTDFGDDGVARMKHLEDGIAIPAGETITLEPGGLHVMFMGLRGTPFEEGNTVAATLIFETSGEVPVTFDIVKRDIAGQEHSHDH